MVFRRIFIEYLFNPFSCLHQMVMRDFREEEVMGNVT